MQEVFNAYKLLELQLPFYILTVEDSNGLTEIVCVCVLAVETKESLEWFIEAFKKRNPAWNKTRVVMADKDINEREIIKSCLPNSALLICLFHTLRTFRREITTDKVNISLGTRTVLLELIEQMAYSSTTEEYIQLRNLFCSSASDEAKTYFMDNWDNIRDQWVMGDKFATGNFLNNTNNRLECLNGKLKQVISKYSSLENLFKQFFIILTTLRGESDHKAIMSFQKSKFSYYKLSNPARRYAEHLTNYASKYVLKQIDLASCNDYIFEMSPDNVYKLQTSNGLALVTPSKCSCSFSTSMRLPCRHIFALRKLKSLPLFDESLCEPRWTASYYKHAQRSFMINDESDNSTPTLGITQLPSTTLTHQRKFHIAHDITKKIANVSAFACGDEFSKRITQLKLLLELWSGGDAAIIMPSSSRIETGTSSLNEVDSTEATSQIVVGTSNEITSTEATSQIVVGTSNEITSTEATSQIVVGTSSLNEPANLASSDSPVPLESLDTTSNKFSHSKLNLTLVPTLKRKGRPKGSESTNVIGIQRPKKKKKCVTNPQTFIELERSVREKNILAWCVGSEKAADANLCLQLTEYDLDATKIDPAIFNSDIMCLKSVQYLFTSPAWSRLNEMIATKKSHHIWVCNYCREAVLLADKFVDCKSCLLRYHANCTEKRRKKEWVCKFCRSKHKIATKETPPKEIENSKLALPWPKLRKMGQRCESNSSSSESEDENSPVDNNSNARQTLRTIALQYDSNSESEDEDCPDAAFVTTLQELHVNETLQELLAQSYDATRNPLLLLSKNGVIRSADVEKFQKEFPDFFADIKKVRKMHGCFTYLNKFINQNYPQLLHEQTSVFLSQMEYLHTIIYKLSS